MAGGQTKKPGMKKRAPYNPYVAKERQRKYFDSRKQENRWKRQKKHIFGSEEGRGSTERAPPAAVSTRNDEAAEDHHDRHDADEDYERNLAFPSVVKNARSTEEATAAGTSEKVRKGKVLKPSVEVAELVVGDEQDVRMQQEPRLGRRSRRNRKTKSEAQAMSNDAADELGAGTSSGDTPPPVGENLSSVQHARKGDLDAEGKAKLSRKKPVNKDEASSATARTATTSSSTTKGRGTRFAKVYKKLEEQEQEKRRLQEEKDAENAQRSQKRRATKNKRYHKNHLRESQRNKKGQPRMSNVLKTLMMAKGHKL